MSGILFLLFDRHLCRNMWFGLPILRPLFSLIGHLCLITDSFRFAGTATVEVLEGSARSRSLAFPDPLNLRPKFAHKVGHKAETDLCNRSMGAAR
jgi:hypothetical protein